MKTTRKEEIEMAKEAKRAILEGEIMVFASQKEVDEALAICQKGIDGTYPKETI